MTVVVTRNILRNLSAPEAAALLKVHQDGGGPTEVGLLEEWLDASADNRAAWAALDASWRAFDGAEDSLLASLRADALSRIESGGGRSWRRLSVAASLLIAFLGGVVLLTTAWGTGHRFGAQGGRLGPSEQTYIAAENHLTIPLADGSQIKLAEHSQVRVAFERGERRIELVSGRALFTVRHDESRPFRVVAGQWSVTDFGTRFEVGLEPEGFQVALYQGSVRVDGDGFTGAVLLPGQRLMARAGRQPEVSSNGPNAEATWDDGMAEFDNVTLEDAVQQFNASNSTKLVIMDAKVARLRISGRFSLQDPSRFCAMISELLPVKVVHRGSQKIELRSRG